MEPPHHKILGSTWFLLHGGETVGIVLMYNGYEHKAYIGKGTGVKQKIDEITITKWGTPFPVEIAKILVGVEMI